MRLAWWSLPLITVMVSDANKEQSDPIVCEEAHTSCRRLSAYFTKGAMQRGGATCARSSLYPESSSLS
jgi:hypothetical protein